MRYCEGVEKGVLRRAWQASLYEIADHVATQVISQPRWKLPFWISVARRAGELQRGYSVPLLRRQGTTVIGCIGFTFVLLVEESRTNTKVLWS
jgi:hypothetical protein